MADYEMRYQRILKEFNTAKEEKIRLETKESTLLTEIKEKYGCDSLEMLIAKQKQCVAEKEELEGEIEPLLSGLEDSLL